MLAGEELIESLLESRGKGIDFNAAVAHPDMMRALVKIGKILGPKGLMPNPKVCVHVCAGVSVDTCSVCCCVLERSLGKICKILGPKGLVPNPTAGVPAVDAA